MEPGPASFKPLIRLLPSSFLQHKRHQTLPFCCSPRPHPGSGPSALTVPGEGLASERRPKGAHRAHHPARSQGAAPQVPPSFHPGESAAARHTRPSGQLSDQGRNGVANWTSIQSSGWQERDHKFPTNAWHIFSEHSDQWSRGGSAWRGAALTGAHTPFTETRPDFRQRRLQAACRIQAGR